MRGWACYPTHLRVLGVWVLEATCEFQISMQGRCRDDVGTDLNYNAPKLIGYFGGILRSKDTSTVPTQAFRHSTIGRPEE
jgi:hypothetical protein